MTVKFDKDHNNPKDCQLILCITGSKECIKDRLNRLISEIYSTDGKPAQGKFIGYGGDIQVITPVWNGQKH